MLAAREHAETHVAGLQFPCNVCWDTFETSRAMKEHKKVCGDNKA